MSPREFYLMKPYEFFCAVEGYSEKREMETEVLRFATFRIHQSLVEKPLSIEKFWPMKNDVAPDVVEVTQEWKDKLKLMHNLR